jgi:thioredoxin-like negative regulator of GroEL
MQAAAVSDKTFGIDVLSAATPVLVEFYSDHAPPSAALDEICGAMAGKLKVVRVDVDRDPALRDELHAPVERLPFRCRSESKRSLAIVSPSC